MTTAPQEDNDTSKSFRVVRDSDDQSTVPTPAPAAPANKAVSAPPEHAVGKRFKPNRKPPTARRSTPKRSDGGDSTKSQPQMSRLPLVGLVVGYLLLAAVVVRFAPWSLLVKAVVMVILALGMALLAPKSKPETLEGTVLPDRGFPKVKLWLYRQCKINWVPKINKEQRDELAEAVRQRNLTDTLVKRQGYKQRLIARLRFLANLGITPVIKFANNKSAGKSTTLLGVGSTIKWYTQKSTIALPATANPTTATLGEMARIEGNKTTVGEFAADLDKYDSPLAVEKRLPLTKQGLGILTEDTESAADEDDAQYTKSFMQSMDTIRTKYSVVLEDGGNDGNAKRSLALQAIRLCHVIVFTYLVDAPVTRTRLKGMVTGLWKDTAIPADVMTEFYDDFASKEETGYQIATHWKVAHSIVAAIKAAPGEEIDFENQMRPKEDVEADSLPKWDGTGISVPSDPNIGLEDEEGNLIAFDLFKLGEDTQIAYLEIAVAAFELAGFNMGINIGEPMVANLKPNTPKGIRAAAAPTPPPNSEDQPAGQLPDGSSS